MTSGELQDLIIAALVKRAGGTRRHWRMAVGPVRVYARETHGHCNWSVTPSGGFSQVATIESLLDDIRLQYPFVTEGR